MAQRKSVLVLIIFGVVCILHQVSTQPSPNNDDNDTDESDDSPSLGPRTCKALESVVKQISDYGVRVCQLNKRCDTIQCEAFKYRYEFQLLPCNEPQPAFHVRLYDDEETTYDKIINEGTNIVPFRFPKQTDLIFIIKQYKDSMNIKVDMDFEVSQYPVISDTLIPIDRQHCSGDTDRDEL